jgi:type I restriction-modification system DNA methylase subunit
MASETGKLFPFNNVGLFSDHFLSKRLPAESPLWSSEKLAAENCRAKILAQYKKFTSTYKSPNEAQTEDDFIRPVLALLGYSYIVQSSLKHKGKSNQPDYALFPDDKTKKEAGSFKVKEQEAFYGKALAICDAKYWGRPLDIKLSDKKDTFTNINPSFQIVNYLVGANVDWGILTNGKLWRLYYQKASSRSSTFYELVLEDLLLKGDPEAFLYFYLFFRKEAFLKDAQGKTFLDRVFEGSTDYAAELSDSLKVKVFEKIFPHLARGFLHYRKNELGIDSETNETLNEIYSATLTLLYRLLFILYAEDRDLLPKNEPNYFQRSLAHLKQRVADALHKKIALSKLSTDFWSDLEILFKIIDAGDASLNVPTYNGGLFSQKNPKNDFLKKNKVPDPWLAEALDHLTREEAKDSGQLQFIDYGELEVRHLGSIYEGLLEFHLKIADEDKAVVKEKGREVYKAISEVKNPKEVVKTGELYLENDRHERRETGSFYTPDYIVKYIVQKAVGPILEEKLASVKKLFSEVYSLRAKAQRSTSSSAKKFLTQELNVKKEQAIKELFSLKILDPAMGSGHFLVAAVDFLSDYIIKFLTEHPDNPILEEIERLRSTILDELKEKDIEIDTQRLTPTNLIKRMIMKRCIYGVDLNSMAVELAKLSLWLHSFTLGAPLSFLDHHLKCGNSLIGAAEIGKVIPPGSPKEAEIKRILQGIVAISELTDTTPSEVEQSYDLYQDVLKRQEPFKRRAHVSAAASFLSSIDPHNVAKIELLAESGDLSKAHPDHIGPYQEAMKLALEKPFFHWPLEFPDAFFSPTGEQADSGFDAVIGNPPYVRIQKASKDEMVYLRENYDSATKNFDIYVPFTEKAESVKFTR